MSQLTCPRCSEVVLRRTALGYLCPDCEGCWLGFEQFEKALRLPDFQLQASELEPTLVADAEGVALEEPASCPQCKIRMKRHIYMLDSGVTIDMCREHGMWLDDGELVKIRTFLDDTPLEEPTVPAPRGLFSFLHRLWGGAS